MSETRKYIGFDDFNGKPIYTDSIIGLRMNNATEYYDKVIPYWDEKYGCYSFRSITTKSIFEPDEYNSYFGYGNLYGWGSTVEVLDKEGE